MKKAQQDYMDLSDEVDKEKEERRKLAGQVQGLKNDLEAESFKKAQLDKEILVLR